MYHKKLCDRDFAEGSGELSDAIFLKTLLLGHTPSTAGTFRKKFRKNSGKTPETLSERFLQFQSRVRLDPPKPIIKGI